LSRYVNQGGKRGGAISVFLEVFHADIFEFCELRKQNSGNEDNRARDLFLALWVCDLFMKRVKEDGVWSLMCPDECPGLTTVYGDEFEELYMRYENEKRYKKQIKARKLWKHIIECQMETGLPYMTYKDNANRKSNQKNLGTLTGSNLCSEIVEYCDSGETAVCNLCSLCLPRYIVYENNVPKYDYDKLKEVTRMIVRNLNKVIDDNFYPSENAKISNFRHRPIGIGVQGLADVYNLFECGFESEKACDLNKRIFETIYYASLDESKELAKKHGHYSSFVGSPFSNGILQYQMCGMKNENLLTQENDWNMLINDIKKYGTRNSLLTTLMPTAGTSQIMKCSECFEPHMSNIFVRTTMAGEFVIVNENLVKMLTKHSLWNDDMRKLLILNNGSIQKINSIPQYIKNIFKTAFEISLKNIISQAADRSPFVDQSQSMNLFMATPNFKVLTSAHFYSWKRGLKTGMYYLRTMPATNPLSFGIDIAEMEKINKKNEVKNDDDELPSCRREKGCIVCGS
jgi:ribonucleoside-diphosphate reductase alpha subunit